MGDSWRVYKGTSHACSHKRLMRLAEPTEWYMQMYPYMGINRSEVYSDMMQEVAYKSI